MRRAHRFAVVLALSAAAVRCTSGPSAPIDTRPYADQIAAARALKDTWFRTDAESPIPTGERSTFQGLKYYAVDPAYHVPAALSEEPAAKPVIIRLQTSTSVPRQMRRVGTLTFTINGQPYHLTAFADVDARTVTRLFVPFGDLTNSGETYRGGRYLEMDRTPTGLYDLDFNRAYHPFCVFNPSYECPVPPSENRLPVAIQAGERLR